jgi:hypothetical protein
MAAGIVAFASVIDLFTGDPFHHIMYFDICFLASSLMVLYMVYDAMQDLPPERSHEPDQHLTHFHRNGQVFSSYPRQLTARRAAAVSLKNAP